MLFSIEIKSLTYSADIKEYGILHTAYLLIK